MENIINVEARTKETVIAEVKATISQVNQTALIGSIKIGNCFNELKELVPRGKWYQYIEENIGYSAKKVERFMKISAEYGDENTPLGSLFSKTTLMSDLSYTKALSLIAIPDEEVKTFVENNDISALNVKELEEKIRAMKILTETLEENNENIKAKLEEITEEKARLEKKIEESEEELLNLETSSTSDESVKELREKQEEIDKLLASLDKSKQAEEKLKVKLNDAITIAERKAEEIKREAIEEAQVKIEEAKSEGRKEAEAELAKANANIEKLSKEIQLAGNEDILTIKIKVEEMKEAFEICMQHTQSLDEEMDKKMGKYLTAVLSQMLERLDN